MERISMTEIDKEIDGLSEQLKDLLGVRPLTLRLIDTLSEVSEKWRLIHEELDALCKYDSATNYHLQSKIYDKVVYALDYDSDTKVCHLRIKFKPGEIVLVSDEEYRLSVYESGFLYIQWDKLNQITKYQSIYAVKCELCLPCKFSIKEQGIKSILKPSKIQQGFIKEILLHLG